RRLTKRQLDVQIRPPEHPRFLVRQAAKQRLLQALVAQPKGRAQIIEQSTLNFGGNQRGEHRAETGPAATLQRPQLARLALLRGGTYPRDPRANARTSLARLQSTRGHSRDLLSAWELDAGSDFSSAHKWEASSFWPVMHPVAENSRTFKPREALPRWLPHLHQSRWRAQPLSHLP